MDCAQSYFPDWSRTRIVQSKGRSARILPSECRIIISSNTKLRTEDLESASETTSWISKAEGQRKSCKQGTLDSPNKGVMAEMDPFVASYYWFTNAGSDSALFKFRQLFWTVTNLRNHNIEHGTKDQRAGMPGLCYRINKQWISKEPTQSPPESGPTMDGSL